MCEKTNANLNWILKLKRNWINYKKKKFKGNEICSTVNIIRFSIISAYLSLLSLTRRVFHNITFMPRLIAMHTNDKKQYYKYWITANAYPFQLSLLPMQCRRTKLWPYIFSELRAVFDARGNPIKRAQTCAHFVQCGNRSNIVRMGTHFILPTTFYQVTYNAGKR